MTIIELFNLLGAGVFATSGVLAAMRHGLDWMGALVLAALTAIGGGTIRDLLLDRPVFWLDQTANLWVILATTALVIFYTRHFRPPLGLLRIADALGLALFAILGAQVAEQLGTSPIIVLTMGVLTGCAGGALRDTLVGEIPLIFRSTEAIYSTACVVGILVYMGLQAADVERTLAMLVGMVTIAGLRIAAIIKRIRLPALKDRT